MFKVGNALMCDYVATGANNKHVLVHTYSGDVVVAEFPATLQFAFYVEIFPTKSGITNFNVEVLVGSEAVAGGMVVLDIQERAVPHPAVIILPQTVAQFDGPTSIKVMGWEEDGEKALILQKDVIDMSAMS